MSAGDVVARNAKTVVSAIGGVINVLAVAALLFQYAPSSVAGYGAAVLTAVEVLRSVNVWIVRNESVIAAAAQAGSELVTALENPHLAGSEVA
ncbi:hypothetical protein D7D52_25265 [Nocardia yunnanensis]|uniref:Uncharacterized protein n=1 Tax=Nocardia yunnanensis TaxID=2382165 RepID=A0A386ZJ23_9NOCA|nr:hypothetical protein [Nocardia yunnanensis]AYF76575.1 hypothetical protein D7D52_25265 [Nocardia yunnanensis]